MHAISVDYLTLLELSNSLLTFILRCASPIDFISKK